MSTKAPSTVSAAGTIAGCCNRNYPRGLAATKFLNRPSFRRGTRVIDSACPRGGKSPNDRRSKLFAAHVFSTMSRRHAAGDHRRPSDHRAALPHRATGESRRATGESRRATGLSRWATGAVYGGWLAVLTLSALTAHAGEPYDVFVVQDAAHARSGPGTQHYRTERLSHGQQLTVYGRTSQGWLAIRPTRDSFDWVLADDVTLDPGEQTGVVDEDQSVVWIGTNLGRAKRYGWQVRLNAGQRISVIGRSQRPGPDGMQQWLRIVPPSGEFRWVHQSDVVRTSEELVASLTPDKAESERPRPPLRNEDLVASSPRRPIAIPNTRSVPGTGGDARGEVDVASRDDVRRDGASVLDTRDPSPNDGINNAQEPIVASENVASPVTPVSYEPVVATPIRIDRALIEDLRRRTEQADPPIATMLVSNLMAREASSVEAETVLEAMQHRARQTVVADSTTIDNINKLRDYLSIARRRERTAGATIELYGVAMPTDTNTRLDVAAVSNPSMSRVAGTATSADPPVALLPPQAPLSDSFGGGSFDAPAPSIPVSEQLPSTSPVSSSLSASATSTVSGQLRQVYSARPGSPPFAIVDAAGRTISYATPLPGINLRSHLNQHVTVTGEPGQLHGFSVPDLRVADIRQNP